MDRIFFGGALVCMSEEGLVFCLRFELEFLAFCMLKVKLNP